MVVLVLKFVTVVVIVVVVRMLRGVSLLELGEFELEPRGGKGEDEEADGALDIVVLIAGGASEGDGVV